MQVNNLLIDGSIAKIFEWVQSAFPTNIPPELTKDNIAKVSVADSQLVIETK